METLIIGCDNAAVDMKATVIRHLESKGYQVEDVGVDTPDNPTNYPTVAKRLCDRVREGGYSCLVNSGAQSPSLTWNGRVVECRLVTVEF